MRTVTGILLTSRDHSRDAPDLLLLLHPLDFVGVISSIILRPDAPRIYIVGLLFVPVVWSVVASHSFTFPSGGEADLHRLLDVDRVSPNSRSLRR